MEQQGLDGVLAFLQEDLRSKSEVIGALQNQVLALEKDGHSKSETIETLCDRVSALEEAIARHNYSYPAESHNASPPTSDEQKDIGSAGDRAIFFKEDAQSYEGHPCPVKTCRKRFSRRDNLRRHIKDLADSGDVTHANFPDPVDQHCNECGRYFQRPSGLTRHQQWHETQRKPSQARAHEGLGGKLSKCSANIILYFPVVL